MFDRRSFGSLALCGVVGAVTCAHAASPPHQDPHLARPSGPLRLPRHVAGIRVPDSKLAVSAAELAWAASPHTLYNHAMRTFVFASAAYQKLGTAYDDELVFIASILHDLGLVPDYMSPNERFEIDGANAADAFMRRHGVAEARCGIVWEAIALHTGQGAVARRRGPEVASVGIGAAMDIVGVMLDQVPPELVERLLAEYPRLNFKQNLIALLVDLCRRKPRAQAGSFTAEVGRKFDPSLKIPTFDQAIMAGPFAQ